MVTTWVFSYPKKKMAALRFLSWYFVIAPISTMWLAIVCTISTVRDIFNTCRKNPFSQYKGIKYCGACTENFRRYIKWSDSLSYFSSIPPPLLPENNIQIFFKLSPIARMKESNLILQKRLMKCLTKTIHLSGVNINFVPEEIFINVNKIS